MSNILNNNRTPITTQINRKDCWDFCLSCDVVNTVKRLDNKNVVVNIDLNNGDCVWFDKLYSSNIWENAVNKGLSLKNVGYTGIDNGLISYDKTKISNTNFLQIFLNSVLEIPSNDKRLQLKKIESNNQNFDYTCNITYVDDTQAIECNGGFYQGFWKTENCEYQVLPDITEEDLCFEITLKPSELTNDNFTLNTLYPNNKGMFLYLGTRSENKWWKYYNTESFEKSNNLYFNDEYIKDDYLETKVNDDYIRKSTTEEMLINYLNTNGCINSEYLKYEFDETCHTCCDECSSYFGDDYIRKDDDINENELTSNGDIILNQPDTSIEIKTNNKFLMFDRTNDGFTTNNWIDGTELVIIDNKKPDVGNYHLLFNKTCDGYKTTTIDKLLKEKSRDYSVLDDLYNNAIGFQIKDDGSIGYKYLIKDCENNTYKIESEFTKQGVVVSNKWSKINVLIEKISNSSINKTMIIKIYVNNKLKLVSKELPLLNCRKLNENYNKQETVPYNISIGGGTQGLCDVVYPLYMQLPEYKLPLEKEFGGSFIGYIKNIKIYTYKHNIQEIIQYSYL